MAASTYRSHNQTTVWSATARGSFVESSGPVGGKRKAIDDGDGLDSEGGGVRETRRMRARRLAQNGEVGSQLPVVTIQNPNEILDDAQTTKKVDGSQGFH